MTVRKRSTLQILAMLLLLLLVVGVGIGFMAWFQSWHDDYLSVAEQSGSLDDPAVGDMLDRMNTAAAGGLIALIVLGAIAFAYGVYELLRVLRKSGRKLQAATGSLATSSSELLAVAAQVASSAAQASAATNETTATVEEVRQTAMLAQDKAAEAAELTDDVLESSKVAEKRSQENADTFDQTREAMDVVAEAISRLRDETESVGDIMVRVNDLAEQSNLLSVNASIEAVKAGEAGRGFSVVAQEVKNLAAQSKQAVARVRTDLDDIRKAIAVVVDAVERGREIAEGGADTLHRSVESIRNRVVKAQKAAEAVLQIAATSRQQLAGMEQIEQAVQSIDQAGKQSVSASKQVQQEAERIQALAHRMRDMVQSGQTKPGVSPGL